MKDSRVATIVNIGDELLNGQRLNSNLHWLSKELLKIDVSTKKAVCVRDNISEIKEELSKASDSKYVFITGGLGGTVDDVTVDAISSFLKSEVYFDEKYYAKLKKIFNKKSLKVDDSLKKQAMKIKGVEYFSNHVGTALGFSFKIDRSCYFVFPGVPKEMKYIFSNSIKSNICKSKIKIISSTIETFGLTEGYISNSIDSVMIKSKDVKFSFLPSFKKVSIVLTSSYPDKIQEAQDEIVKILGVHVYSQKGCSLEKVVGNIMIRKKITLSTCESCTAGKLSSMITSVDGSSAYYLGSLITYSDQIKSSLLKISIDKILKYGSVSKEIAADMAIRTSDIMSSDISISITGVSGPNTDITKKAVGTVFIAIKFFENIFVNEYKLDYDRESHRLISCKIALNNLRLMLLNKWADNNYKFK